MVLPFFFANSYFTLRKGGEISRLRQKAFPPPYEKPARHDILYFLRQIKRARSRGPTEGGGRMELLTWVSSAEALHAAVAAGADAVRVGHRDYSLTGLGQEELKKAAVWCRVRGVRLSVAMDLPLPGKSFRAALDAALDLARAGVSSFCVGDPGFLRALRLLLPELPLEASERLWISDAAGLKLIEALGARKLLLPPQLSREEILHVTSHTRLATEAAVCGRVCPALGPCRLSAFAGRVPAAAGSAGRNTSASAGVRRCAPP